jgi:hypothetical protein
LTFRSDDWAGSVRPCTLEPPPPGWLLLLLELLPQPAATIAATATSAVGLPIRIVPAP